MGIAVRSYPPELPPIITQAGLIAALREALITAGYPPALKSYTVGTEMFVVWRLDFDTTRAFGRAFYRLRVTSALLVSHAVGAGFTDATNTLVNPSAESQPITYVSNVVIRFWGFRSEEMTLLSVSQGSLTQLLGFFRFADSPSFDEASFPRIFIARLPDATSFSCTGLSPYGTTLIFSNSLGNTLMSNPDPYLQQRSQSTGVLVYGPSDGGIISRSSDDLASGACVGLVRGDIFQNPNVNPAENFILLRPGAGALLIRIP